ncbi:Ig-like domain-containing protein [Chloroflexota bacterium]
MQRKDIEQNQLDRAWRIVAILALLAALLMTGILLRATYAQEGQDVRIVEGTPLAPPEYPKDVIAMVPGTMEVSADIEVVLLQLLNDAKEAFPSAKYFAVTNVYEKGDLQYISLAGFSSYNGNSWRLDESVWFGSAKLQKQVDGSWTGEVEIPEEPSDSLDSTTASYPFPWERGKSMKFGPYGVHTGGWVEGWKAVDLVSNGNPEEDMASNTVYAMSSGKITYVCNDGTSVAIKIGNELIYAHLYNNSNLVNDHHFNQGDVIGSLRYDEFQPPKPHCGEAWQDPDHFHLHLVFPNNPITLGQWTLDPSIDECGARWKRGKEEVGCGDSLPHDVSGCPQGGAVILYEGNRYDCTGRPSGDGYAEQQNAGLYNIPGDLNDQVSSLHIPQGWSVMLYEHSIEQGLGDSTCRNADDPDLQGEYFDGGIYLNDQVSAYRVYENDDSCGGEYDCPQVGGLILYYDGFFYCHNMGNGHGYQKFTNAGLHNIASTFNDQASSIRIPSGWSAQLYEHSDGGGDNTWRCYDEDDFVGDIMDGGVGLNDKVSSIEIHTDHTCGGGMPPDFSAPTVEQTEPTHGGHYYNSCPIAIKAEANDSESGIAFVDFFVGYDGLWNRVGTDYSYPYKVDWDCSSISDQGLWFVADARDHAGNWDDQYDPVWAGLDRMRPTVHLASPSSGDHFDTCPITIQAEASDGGSGIDYVNFWAGYDGEWHMVGSDEIYPYVYNWDCSEISDQGIWFLADTVDNAGNWDEQYEPIWAMLDRTEPMMRIMLPVVLKH